MLMLCLFCSQAADANIGVEGKASAAKAIPATRSIVANVANAAKAQAEAASACSEMEASIKRLADGPSSPRQAYVAATLPLAAACLLSRASLIADSEHLRIQLEMGKHILKEAQAYDSWCYAMQQTLELQEEVVGIVSSRDSFLPEYSWVSGWFSMPRQASLNRLMWSPSPAEERRDLLSGWGRLQEQKHRCTQAVGFMPVAMRS